MYNSIFQKPWWLDATAPGHWDEVVIKRRDEIAARLPYVLHNVLHKRYGYIYITMPRLTQTLGPCLRSSTAKYTKRLSQQKDLMFELIDGLPKYDYFCQNFHYSITNWLPFYWKGFQQTTRYTYVLEDITDKNKLWDGLMSNIKTDIKKAENRFHLEVKTDLGIDKFLDINELTFKRQNRKPSYSRNFVKRLDAACAAHNARKIFFAQDTAGQIHAANYIIWDENSAYYLMGGGDPEFRNSGASSLLMWEAILFATTVTQRFDFEGSMIEPVERFFRAFGARQVPYFQIIKDNKPLVTLVKKAFISEKSKIAGAVKRMMRFVSS